MLLDIGLPIVTFLLGGLVGHRLALGRDKRKEFNEYSDPIRDALWKQKETLDPMDSEKVDDKSTEGLTERAPIHRRAAIKRAINDYRATFDSGVHRMKRDGYFARFQPEDREALEASIDRLLFALKRL